MSTGTVEKALSDLERLAGQQGRNDLAAVARGLRGRLVAKEWFVVLLGETSSGKSTWVNSLLGEALLPATPGATTGAVVEVRFVPGITGPIFEELNADGPASLQDREQFRAACRGEGRSRRLRLQWPLERVPGHLVGGRDALAGMVLLDTPGYNSCLGEHSDLLVRALPEADMILSMLSFRRGLTPEDLSFLRLARSLVDDQAPAPILFAANFTPEAGGERQISAMQEAVRRNLLPDASIFPLATKTQDGRHEVWNPELWHSLSTCATAPERQDLIVAHVAAIAAAVARELLSELQARVSVSAAEEDQLEAVRTAIAQYRDALARGQAKVREAESDMHALVAQERDGARNLIWQLADAAIEDSGRFTEATACIAHVKDHLVPQRIREAGDRIEQRLLDRSDRLGQELDDLQMEVESIPLPEVRIWGPQWEAVRDSLVSGTLKRTAEQAFTAYLRRLGGAGGFRAGFVNLAKKVTSKAGRLFNRSFSREVYDAIGSQLRRIGLKAEVAGAAFAAALVELAAYAYGVARWKARLRGQIQRLLGLEPTHEPIEDTALRLLPSRRKQRLPVDELACEAELVVRDAMQATRGVVDQNYRRRIEVLEEALAARASSRREDPAILASVAGELGKVIRDLASSELGRGVDG